MKKCPDIQAELSAYIDNELATGARAVVEEHVRGCRVCQERLTELKTLATGVTALSRLQPAPQFLAEVRRKIARDKKPQPAIWQDFLFRPLWLKVPLGGLAILVVVALVMRFERPVNEHDRAAMPAEKPASAPMAAEGESHLIDKLVPKRLVGSATPSAPVVTTPSPATAGLQQTMPVEVIVVHAKDFNDVESRARQFAVAINGRVVPPSSQETLAQTFFVELPQENVASFKARLLQAAERTKAMAEGQLAAKSESTSEVVGGIEKKAGTVVLEIQVVPPAD